MKKYKVDSEQKGVVMIDETPYRAGQTIVVNDKDKKAQRAIAKLLKLKESPIELVKETSEPAENKLVKQQKEEEERANSSTAPDGASQENKKRGAK